MCIHRNEMDADGNQRTDNNPINRFLNVVINFYF